jgi:hypothetical protein
MICAKVWMKSLAKRREVQLAVCDSGWQFAGTYSLKRQKAYHAFTLVNLCACNAQIK